MKKLPAVVLLASLVLNGVLLLRPPEEERTPPAHASRIREVQAPPPPPAQRPIPPAREVEEAPQKPAIVPHPPFLPAFLPSPPPRVAPPVVSLIAAPPGTEITVTCTVHSGVLSPRDWVGLYVLGADVSKYAAYRMVSAESTSHTYHTYTFTAPLRPGLYEARYILDDDKTSVATSNPFTIPGDPAPPPQVALSSLTLLVKRGGEIPAGWTHLSGRPARTDWIGLYEPDAKNEDYLTWKYVTDAASGQVTLTAPDKPGTYELRYLLDNGYESVAIGPRIVVIE